MKFSHIENNCREETQVMSFQKYLWGEINRKGKLRSRGFRLHDVKTCFFKKISPIPCQKP